MRISIVKNNIVENVIEAKSLAEAQALFKTHTCRVAVDEVIGDQIIANVLTKAPKQKISNITKKDFLGRFSDAELAAIYAKEATDITVKIFLDKINNADDIDLNATDLIKMMAYLQAQGHLTKARSDEILA